LDVVKVESIGICMINVKEQNEQCTLLKIRSYSLSVIVVKQTRQKNLVSSPTPTPPHPPTHPSTPSQFVALDPHPSHQETTSAFYLTGVGEVGLEPSPIVLFAFLAVEKTLPVMLLTSDLASDCLERMDHARIEGVCDRPGVRGTLSML
jgi:hypothetical protein